MDTCPFIAPLMSFYSWAKLTSSLPGWCTWKSFATTSASVGHLRSGLAFLVFPCIRNLAQMMHSLSLWIVCVLPYASALCYAWVHVLSSLLHSFNKYVLISFNESDLPKTPLIFVLAKTLCVLLSSKGSPHTTSLLLFSC